MCDIGRLNRDFGGAGVTFVDGPGGLAVAEVELKDWLRVLFVPSS